MRRRKNQKVEKPKSNITLTTVLMSILVAVSVGLGFYLKSAMCVVIGVVVFIELFEMITEKREKDGS